ncbi:MAG: hypothetical protein GY801_26505 [bacterium]|nr:hypothetical protein [bacterium]
MINTLVFDSQLLPDGHLTCPQEFIRKKNIQFKVLVIFEEATSEATVQDIERAAFQDMGSDFLSDEERQYYLDLEDL